MTLPYKLSKTSYGTSKPHLRSSVWLNLYKPMSHKTETDGFAGHQINPGHGRIHIREDKHMMVFESRKTFRMWSRKRNPRKIAWTEHYRFDHKKSNTDKVENSSKIKRTKVQRGYAGVSSDQNAQLRTDAVKRRVQQNRRPQKK